MSLPDIQPHRKVIISVPSFQLSGVTTAAVSTAQGLRQLGLDARLLVAGSEVPSHEDLDGWGRDLWMNVRLNGDWRDRCASLAKHLAQLAPCIYVPNNDWDFHGIAGLLDPQVRVVGVLHSDDEEYYSSACAVGGSWDRIIVVSAAIAETLGERCPALRRRTRAIPCGVDVPPVPPPRNHTPGRPLKMIYAGRLSQVQKRVLDLPAILARLTDAGANVQLTIVGDGYARAELERRVGLLAITDRIRFLGRKSRAEVVAMFADHDVFVLTSEFEGLPLSMLEAMAQGCVPVVTRIRSGIPQVVRDGSNGFTIPIGDIEKFSSALQRLASDRELLAKMSPVAHATIRDQFPLERMATSYYELFDEVFNEVAAGRPMERTKGLLIPAHRRWRARSHTWLRYRVGPLYRSLRRLVGIGGRD